MVDDESLTVVSKVLREKNILIATAESCTGGLIAHTLTNVSGSSEYFERGVVSYSNTAKKELLGVPEELLIEYGAVSEPVARAMAEGIRKRSHVDIGIATTGIAGPTGGTKEKSVGLVYISVSTSTDTKVKKFLFNGTRLAIKKQTCQSALQMLSMELKHM